MMRGLVTAILSTLLGAAAARAQDNDLERIPNTANVQQPPPAATGNERIYVQNDALGTLQRDDLIIPFPPPPPARWEERLFADARLDWALAENLRFVFSDRFNLRAEDGLDFPSHESVRNDLREAYFAWTAGSATFFDAGRINLKSGVALGFNPTDFFKTRAVVEPLSADPSVLREDRLGTLMLMGQHLWEHAALTLAFAPKVTNPSPVYRNDNLPSFNPMLDRTNATNRFLAKGSANLFEDFAPELIAFSQDGHWSYGANLTRGFGQKIVGYVEWAGGDSLDLVDSAIQFGKKTGTIPPPAPSPLPGEQTPSFQNAVAAGLSYTTESKITFNFEYHYNQAGFSDAQWTHWFGAGANPFVDQELWYIRGYAAEQLEPVPRQEAFIRADWLDAFVEDLEITAFINMDLRDTSSFSQITADYYLSRQWTVGMLATASFGGRRSDYGSLPSKGTLLFRVSRYF
jgi:hypothetical protein